MKNIILATIVTAGLLVSTAALAVDNGGPIDKAMDAGKVGEQADGYLGFVTPPTPAQDSLKDLVNSVNIARRKVYADVSDRTGQTIDRAAVLQALRQITKLQTGEYFKDMTGTWCAKGPTSDVRVAPDDTIVIRCRAAPSPAGR